jgi:hypothetical protein
VLLRLADRADWHGRCWPSHQRTAADLHLSESTCRVAVQTLKKAGLLKIERRKAAGRDASNLYLLSLDSTLVCFPYADAREGVKFQHPGADLHEFRVPKSGAESKRGNLPTERMRAGARTAGASTRPSRSGRGGLELDSQTGILHNPHDKRDTKALAEIKTHSPFSIEKAVAQAAELDDQDRAFPSGVLRLLRGSKAQAGQSANSLTPAWARRHAAATTAPPIKEVIEGETRWAD